jgi:dipeptidase
LSLDSNWQIGSRDLESFARGEGWWRGSGRIDLAAAYRNRQVPGFISEGRQRRAQQLLAEGDGAHDAASLQRLLRDHGGGSGPPVDASSDDERFYTLCMHSEPVGTTTASIVAGLPEDREAPWPVWVSFGNPCVGVFMPVYIDGLIPAALARGEDEFDEGSVWWVFERLQRAAEADLVKSLPILRDGWASLEEKIERERIEVEALVRSLTAEDDAQAAALTLTDFMARTVGQVLDHAEGLRARITG